MDVRQRAGRGLIGRIQFTFRNRPVLAVAVSVVSLLVVATAITFTTPLRCGPAKALGLKNIASGCITVAAAGSSGSAAIVPRATPFPGQSNPYPPNRDPSSGPDA